MKIAALDIACGRSQRTPSIFSILSAWLCIINGMSKPASPLPFMSIFHAYFWRSRWCAVSNTFWTNSYKNDHSGRRIAAVALLRRYALSSPTSSPVVHTAVLSLLQKGSVLAELYYYLQLYNNSVCAFTM